MMKFRAVKVCRFLSGVGFLLGMLSALGSSNRASASLVFAGLVPGGGAGIGTSNVVLTVHGPNGAESGCVGWSSTGNVIGSAACPTANPTIPGGDEQTGSSQTQTRSVTETGVTNAEYLFVIFNANEPSGDAITVENLVLTIYDAGGALLFTSGDLLNRPTVIDPSNQGQGNLGFGFAFDATQAAAAQQYITCGGCGTNRFGLAALLSDNQGSNEVFSIAMITPEPYTFLTVAGGLIALGLFCRRFRARA